MCLSVVTRKFPASKPHQPSVVEEGWVVLRQSPSKKLCSVLFDRGYQRPGKWIKSGPLHASLGLGYPAGWHIFKARRDAKKYSKTPWLQVLRPEKLTIREVKYKGILAEGTNEGGDYKAVVARWRLIIPERRKKR